MTPHFHKIVPKIKNAQLVETKICLHPLSDDVRAQLLNEKSTDSQDKGYRSIARFTFNWCIYNHRNRSFLPPSLSSIPHFVKVRRKIQSGWQEEIKLRKRERAPFILLDLNSHAFPLFLLQMCHHESDPITRQRKRRNKGGGERTRKEDISYCSPCSTVRAWPPQTR